MTDFLSLDSIPEPTAAELLALEAESDTDLIDEILLDVLDREDTVSLDAMDEDDEFYEDDYEF